MTTPKDSRGRELFSVHPAIRAGTASYRSARPKAADRAAERPARAPEEQPPPPAVDER